MRDRKSRSWWRWLLIGLGLGALCGCGSATEAPESPPEPFATTVAEPERLPSLPAPLPPLPASAPVDPPQPKAAVPQPARNQHVLLVQDDPDTKPDAPTRRVRVLYEAANGWPTLDELVEKLKTNETTYAPDDLYSEETPVTVTAADRYEAIGTRQYRFTITLQAPIANTAGYLTWSDRPRSKPQLVRGDVTPQPEPGTVMPTIEGYSWMPWDSDPSIELYGYRGTDGQQYYATYRVRSDLPRRVIWPVQ